MRSRQRHFGAIQQAAAAKSTRLRPLPNTIITSSVTPKWVALVAQVISLCRQRKAIVVLVLVLCLVLAAQYLYERTVTTNKISSIPSSASIRNVCDGYAGIYHIQSGDVGGAAATIFFQFVIAQLIYAEDHQLKPWVFLNNVSHHIYDQQVHNRTGAMPTLQLSMMAGMRIEHVSDGRLKRAAYPGHSMVPPGESLVPKLFQFSGDGVWEHYFEPVSDFDPHVSNCSDKPLVTMDIWSITPGLHIYAPWTPRMWRYSVLPDYMQQRHLTLREWLTPQRIKAHAMVQKYISVKPSLWNLARQVLDQNTIPTNVSRRRHQHCVGIHIRWSDKGGGRRILAVDEFLLHVQEFLKRGGNCVVVATDSSQVLHHIQTQWPPDIVTLVRFQRGYHILRSYDTTPVFEMTRRVPITTTTTTTTLPSASGQPTQLVSHHETNTQVLVDILALSLCDFLIHGHSAVSDAAMYINDKLIYQSVNLEDPRDLSRKEFGDLVHDVLVRHVGVNHTRYFPQPWWKQHANITAEAFRQENPHTNQQKEHDNDRSNPTLCDGYRGILHILVGGGDEFSFGMTFFHFILNQLIYATKYQLKPYIHLKPQQSHAVFDPSVHGRLGDQNVSLQGFVGAAIQNDNVEFANQPEAAVPGDFRTTQELPSMLTLSGNGIWDSYFRPASDFHPASKDEVTSHSCQGKAWVTLNHSLVTSGLHLWAPWSVRSFRYSNLHERRWRNANDHSLSDWYLPMRTWAHDVVRKYYRPLSFINQRVDQVTGITEASQACCLAIHIRQGDKEGYGKRKVSRIRDYKPFVEAFLNATTDNSQSFVYLATDAWRVMDAIQENWDEAIRLRIRSQGDLVVRSVRWVPPHMLEPENRHRVNLEALVDILAMSRCQFLLHGFSTMSEAAIYVNLNLHNHSVNLDDPNHMDVNDFASVVRNSRLCHGI
jgi:hypothetical protein